MANPYGRTVIVPLTNQSGGGVIAGDVVVVDTAHDSSFTTTTSANFTGGVGVAQQTIGAGGTGLVALSGQVDLVNVNASVTRGHFGATYTVAKQATDAGASRGAGTFCQFITGGTTPKAVIYPVDLLGTSLTNPMTTTGDMIYSADNSGTPARLAAVAAGSVLSSAGTGTAPAWAAPAGVLLVAKASGSTYTVTGTSMTALDTTNLRATITAPASGRVLAKVGGTLSSASTSFSFHFGVLDGVTVAMDAATYQPGGTAMSWIMSVEATQVFTLSAGSHTLDASALNSVGSKSVTLYGAWMLIWAAP